MKECLAFNVISKESNQTLENVKSSENLLNFKSLYISQSPECYFLPAGITNKFINLEVLVISHTGLKSITQDDLKPFVNLRGLYIDYSKITSIEGNLFINNKNLEELSLQQNGIKYVEADSLKSLRKLTSFSFDKNECYDGNATGRDDVADLFISIVANCNVRHEVETTTQKRDENSDEIKNRHAYEDFMDSRWNWND